MSAPIRVLELRSVRGTGGGPDKTILLGAARATSRVVTTVCYIRDVRDKVFCLDRKAESLGVDYVEVTERHSFDLRVWATLRTIVRHRGIHIVHGHEHKSTLFAWALGLSDPVIPICTAHGWSGSSATEHIYYAVEKRIIARLPRSIAVSEHICDELVRTGTPRDRVAVIQNGIDHRTFVRKTGQRSTMRRALGIADDHLVIGAVGRLESEKRFDHLIEALAVLKPKWPNARLLIVGEGSLRPLLENLVATRGLGSACTFLGLRDDVSGLHHAFDVFVQSSEREGTPNCVLEAMSLETPVVATDVGGTRGIISDGVHGLIVPRHDVRSLAAAVDAVLSDPEAARVRSSAARRRVESDFSFERRMDRVERLYEELVAGEGVRRGCGPHEIRHTCTSGVGT